MLVEFYNPNRWNNGYNTVLTGEAGSGKSWTVEHEIIDKYGDKCKIALTGMTGLASCNIKGQTIHSWLNLGVIYGNKKYDDNGLQQNIDRIIYSKNKKWEHVKKTDVLIIDEISMCDGLTFDVINSVLQIIRDNEEPFGGIQMILVGDNYQIPPVKANVNGYYFQSQAYKNGNFIPVVLKEQHRQKKGQFLDVLNRIRVGKHTQSDIDYLKQREVKVNKKGCVEVPDDTVILMPKNEKVDAINEMFFKSIDAPIEYFNAKDERLIPKMIVKGQVVDDKLDESLRVPKCLQLKSGCSVILLANLDVSKGIVNGSQGIFYGKYCDKLLCKVNGEMVEVPRQKFEVYKQDKKVFVREQYPLMLGYAITIHKSQGMTLKSAYIDFSEIFAPHQSYVALSRVKSIEGLYIKGLTKEKIWVDKNVVDYMTELER